MVADDKMAAFHGAGLRRYLLTVMAAAAKAFKHPSIRNPVNLVVTRLVILGPGEEGPQVGPSAAQTLRSFCTWQQGLNAPQDSDPDHFDTAVLFTRQVSPPAPQTARATPGTLPPRAAARTRPRWPPLPPGPEEAQRPAPRLLRPSAAGSGPGVLMRLPPPLHRTCAGSPPATPWAWPTWALCATRLGAALSWRTTGCSRPSLLLTNWVRRVDQPGVRAEAREP